jgi:dihydropteroate synthase
VTKSATAGGSTHPRWILGAREIEIMRPVIFGIVNVTPDSFSDGGVSFSVVRAVARALELVEQGADVVDVGGESTRPGAEPVPLDEELSRVVPVIEGVLAAAPHVLISVDTVKAGVAERALRAGASVVNDVSAFRLDPGMAAACAEAGCGVILMHSRGGVTEMASYATARYGPDVIGEVAAELRQRADHALSSGIAKESIVLDPGFGFSKTSAHSLAVLRELERVCALGYPVMAGLSRKRMIGELTGIEVAAERDAGSVGAAVVALARGASLFRVHDVRLHRHALDAAWRVLRGE